MQDKKINKNNMKYYTNIPCHYDHCDGHEIHDFKKNDDRVIVTCTDCEFEGNELKDITEPERLPITECPECGNMAIYEWYLDLEGDQVVYECAFCTERFTLSELRGTNIEDTFDPSID